MSTLLYSTRIAKAKNAKKAEKRNRKKQGVGNTPKQYHSLTHEIQGIFKTLASTRWQDEVNEIPIK